MFQVQLRSALARVALSLIVVLSVAGASPLASAQSNGVNGTKINWLKYMQHASTASAIAMALSHVGHCSKRLGIREEDYKDPESGEDLVILSFSCVGNEDEEGSAFLFFLGTRKMLEEHFEQGPKYGPPIFKKFEFAG